MSGLNLLKTGGELVGSEVAAEIDATDKIEWAVNRGPFTGAGLVEQDKVWPKIVEPQWRAFSRIALPFSARTVTTPPRSAIATFSRSRPDDLWAQITSAVSLRSPPVTPPPVCARIAQSSGDWGLFKPSGSI
jgi:hypothetical protein